MYWYFPGCDASTQRQRLDSVRELIDVGDLLYQMVAIPFSADILILGNTVFPASQCTWEGFHAGINKG